MTKRRVYLHARDIAILEQLADHRVDTLDALKDQHWPDGARKTAYNRLTALANAGYLEHVRRPQARPVDRPGKPASEHLFLLGAKAPTALRLRGREAHAAKAARRWKPETRDALIDHQLAVNRIGTWLGTPLISEHDASAGLDRRHRPDAAYRAQPDPQGRDLILIEADLGHYTRDRILAKIHGLLQHPDARGMLLATPTPARANAIARWASEHYGDPILDRLQVFAFDELRNGAALDDGTQPETPEELLGDNGWYRLIGGRPGNS